MDEKSIYGLAYEMTVNDEPYADVVAKLGNIQEVQDGIRDGLLHAWVMSVEKALRYMDVMDQADVITDTCMSIARVQKKSR